VSLGKVATKEKVRRRALFFEVKDIGEKLGALNNCLWVDDNGHCLS